MSKILTVLPAAGCLLVMCPLMMALMMRSGRQRKSLPSDTSDETAKLRAEVAQLRAEVADSGRRVLTSDGWPAESCKRPLERQEDVAPFPGHEEDSDADEHDAADDLDAVAVASEP